MSATSTILSWAIQAGFGLLILAVLFAFIRLVRGPSLPDRVVALDLLAVIAVAFSALAALASGVSAYLDVAIAVALVAFLATVAFARFIERRRAQESDLRVATENKP